MGGYTPPPSGAVAGPAGRRYRLVSGTIRNTAGVWAPINDANHRPSGIASVDTFSDRIVINYDFTGRLVSSFQATPDDTLAQLGYAVGASVGLSSTTLYLSKPGGLMDYVFWDPNGAGPGVAGWKSFTGVFTFPVVGGSGPSSIDAANGLRLQHASCDISAGLAAQANHRGGNYIAAIGSVANTVTYVEFYDFAGVKVTVPNSNMKVWVTRQGSAAVDPTKVTAANNNIWITGLFEL